MLHVISMHRPGDPRQTAVSDFSKVIPCLVAPKFEHSTLAVRAKHPLSHSNYKTQEMQKQFKLFEYFLTTRTHIQDNPYSEHFFTIPWSSFC
jgi:hypothetical protein